MTRWREYCARAERAAGRWALPAGFLVAALVLAGSAWVRPPLSRDVSSFHLSIIPGPASDPNSWLTGPRAIVRGSPGVGLTALVAVGAVVVALRPGRLGTLAGLLLAAAILTNAAVLLNHPALVEALDREQEQRALVARVLSRSPEENVVTNSRNGRVARIDEPICELARGVEYLRAGPWLVGWAAVGTFFASPGGVARRLAAIAIWTAAGCGAAAVVTLPRLHAEYHLAAADRHEADGDTDAARDAITRAIAVFPELGRLERTWLALGRLDVQAEADTPQARYFRAAQLGRRERWAEAVALLSGEDEMHPAVRVLTARLWAAAGLDHYTRDPEFTDAGASHVRRDRHLAAAGAAWEQGLAADPSHRGCAVALALVDARLHPGQPEQIERRLGAILTDLADRPIRADLLATLGDAHLEAGDVAAARRRYAESFRAFNLPTAINYRAQKGLGGW